uniref:Protein kinase domain-containing protein n=1 Tax=Zooxanthella nutricula TaxID=1333877 RepID=A0A7S2J8H7_9DINO
MERVSAQAYHRDAHARNILVADRGPGASPRLAFGLIDFGLAVDADGWRLDGWRRRGVAGDGRYWPASAWVMWAFDVEGMQADDDEGQVLREEYAQCLDLHSIGMTALQVFVELLGVGISLGVEEALDACAVAFDKLSSAWAAYWTFASTSWNKVAAAYAAHGHAEALKDDFAAAGVPSRIAELLDGLRAAVREASNICALEGARAPGGTRGGVSGVVPSDAPLGTADGCAAPMWRLLEAISVLIGGPGLGEAPRWQDVARQLGRSDEAACGGNASEAAKVLDASRLSAASTVTPQSSMPSSPVSTRGEEVCAEPPGQQLQSAQGEAVSEPAEEEPREQPRKQPPESQRQKHQLRVHEPPEHPPQAQPQQCGQHEHEQRQQEQHVEDASKPNALVAQLPQLLPITLPLPRQRRLSMPCQCGIAPSGIGKSTPRDVRSSPPCSMLPDAPADCARPRRPAWHGRGHGDPGAAAAAVGALGVRPAAVFSPPLIPRRISCPPLATFVPRSDPVSDAFGAPVLLPRPPRVGAPLSGPVVPRAAFQAGVGQPPRDAGFAAGLKPGIFGVRVGVDASTLDVGPRFQIQL